MSEDAPIPGNLRNAFHFTVLNTPRHWNPEIISLDGKSFTPSAICGLARKFADPMPRFIYDVLHELGYAEGDLSHGAGARFLMDLIERRKALYRWAHQS